jgi:hypothetical protein
MFRRSASGLRLQPPISDVGRRCAVWRHSAAVPKPYVNLRFTVDSMMLRRTNSWLVNYTLRRRVCSLVRKALGFAIVLSGFAVILVYLVRRVSTVQ